MMDDARAMAIAAVRAEIAQMEALSQPVPLRPQRRRRVTNGSVVYSIRLDPDEVGALEARAAALGTKPTALARNFIRNGLGARDGKAVGPAVERLEAALDELRAAVLPMSSDAAQRVSGVGPISSPCGGTARKVRRLWRS